MNTRRTQRSEKPESMSSAPRSNVLRRSVALSGLQLLVPRLVLTFDQHNRLCRRRIEKLGWLKPSMQ
jgi:hypothetical protein